MPEGPEVRTITDDLQWLVGWTLTGVSQARPDPNIHLEQLIWNQAVRAIRCWGKKIIFDFTASYLVSSLGMTGGWFYSEDAINLVILSFQRDNLTARIFYRDVRGFGSMISSREYPTLNLGPDPLQADIPIDYWNHLLDLHGRAAIVNLLYQQEHLAGIGNYLRCEILFAAGIMPFRKAYTLTPEERERLRQSIQQEIRRSYQLGGFTIKNYLRPTGQKGNYVAAIYGQSVDPYGYPVSKCKQGQSTIWWSAYAQH